MFTSAARLVNVLNTIFSVGKFFTNSFQKLKYCNSKQQSISGKRKELLSKDLLEYHVK